MTHLHNSDVLNFLKLNKDNPNVKKHIEKQQGWIEELNEEFNMNYKDYLDYLEQNIGDDASYTMDELKELIH
jgi:hypothetical protein